MWKIIGAVLVGAAAVVFWNYKQNEDSRKSVDVLIAIPSARHHFTKRDSIRRTWLSLKPSIPDVSMKSVFVVGEHGCPYPPDDRMDEFGCQTWAKGVEGFSNEEEFTATVVSQPKSTFPLRPGFTFRVKHPIEIHKIGIFSGPRSTSNSTAVTAILYNKETEEQLATATFDVGSREDEGRFIWKKVEPVVLLEDVEVFLTADMVSEEEVDVECRTSFVNMDGVIQYTAGVSHDHQYYEKLLTRCCYSVNFQYRIQDQQRLRDHVGGSEDRFKEHNRQMSRELGEITREIDMHDDIVFVDIYDTYRNLTSKMAKFYSWAVKHFKFRYLLKTDDDVFVDLPAVMKHVQMSDDLGWWSNFRESWVVSQVGKWADFEYRSASYPPFGCGAGSVLTYKVVEWLAQNQESLKKYPFEDTALGIWVSAIDVEFRNDRRWTCDRACRDGDFNVAELTLEDMYKTWESYMKCKHICNCNEL